MRSIALVGTTPTADSAPYDDPNWEIWGVAARAKIITRADRWFELHRIDGESKAWQDFWRASIKRFSHDLELWMFYPEPDLGPKVLRYPAERITARFGTYFMTSTFSWMIALAIDEMCPYGEPWEPGEIGIWGVEMEHGTEYSHQRTGFRHFIDLARVMGITITRLVDSGLSFEPVPYPFWQDDPMLSNLKKRTARTELDLKTWEKSLRITREMISQVNAVLDEVALAKTKGYDPQKRVLDLEKEGDDLVATSAALSKQITEAEGRHEEQQWLADYMTP